MTSFGSNVPQNARHPQTIVPPRRGGMTPIGSLSGRRRERETADAPTWAPREPYSGRSVGLCMSVAPPGRDDTIVWEFFKMKGRR